MEQLPKIVRSRLQGGAVSEHPDPDTLTAFAERSLMATERTQVLAHLSSCSICREVLSLAAPEIPANLPQDDAVAVRKIKTAWLRWPVLHWGALAASLVVVGAAVLVYETDRRSMAPSEVRQTDAVVEHTLPAQPEQASPGYMQQRGEAKELAPFPSPARRQSAKPSSRVRANEQNANSITGALVGERKTARSSAAPATRDALVGLAHPSPANASATGLRSQAPAASAETVEVTGATPQVTTSPSTVKGSTGSSREPRAGMMAKAAPAFVPRSPAETAASTIGGAKLVDFHAPQWRLSDDGIPQRSFDSGKSWDDVRVEKGMSFRALSSQSADVWVGGSKGTLYHSSDFGLHWIRVIPVANSSPLSEDVVRIAFSDVAHGTITTASGTVWVTSDAGKSWQTGQN
jgi:hypothetical protein